MYALNLWAEANNRGKYEPINDIMQDKYTYIYRDALKGLQRRADDICGVPKELRTS